jgi:uncharacterized protein
MRRTALITGSSGGIGLELAKIHAEKGHNLVLVALSREILNELKTDLERDYKVQVYVIEKDLSHPDNVREVYDELKQNNISIDYLINNAGFGDFGFFAESNWDKQKKMINLNITAVTYFTRLFLTDMINRGEGKIMNISSTAAFQPGPTMSVYFATKAFVLSFSEAVNNEVRDKGISITAFCPGSTDTGFHAVVMGDGNPVKKRKLSSASQVAKSGYRAMMRGKPVAIHGFMNSIMATCVRFMPRGVVVKVARMIQENKHK